MYFLRFGRLPLVLLVVIGFTMRFPEPYQAIAYFLAWASSTIMLVEHLIILAVSVHYGGWQQGPGVAGLAIMMSGMTLPEFYGKAREIMQKAEDELVHEQATAAKRAQFAEAARRAAAAERVERARRYTRRLHRLLGSDSPELERTGQALATFHPLEAEARLRRVERMDALLTEADRFGEEHVRHLTALFDRRLTAEEEERQAQAYLAQVRRRRGMLEEARQLGVTGDVVDCLQLKDEAAAEAVLIRARASAARHLELQQLEAQVARAPGHLRGHLTELLANVRANLGNPRQFRKAAYALREAMPKNGKSAHRS